MSFEDVTRSGSRGIADVVLGPVGVWVGAGATVLIVIVTALVALGVFDSLRGPRIRLTFEPTEPWCRNGRTGREGAALWVRIGVENVGPGPARGCLARLITVATGGEPRHDVDPVQLRWAGVPRSRAFDPMDIRRDQREFINVIYLSAGSRWHMVTFEDPDFDPGFVTDLPLDQRHVLQISVFADNARTATTFLVAEPTSPDKPPNLHLA